MTQTTTVEQMQAELQEVNVNGALVIEKLKALVHTSNSHRILEKEERASRGADLMLTLGLLAATGTMATGVADWSDLNGVARRVGLLHGVFSGTVMFTNLISWVLRLTGKRHAGVAFSTAGYLASLFSAYLAGELIFIMSPKSSVNESGEVPRAS